MSRTALLILDRVSEFRPAPRDFFVSKPRHSGFYATPLSEMLEWMRVRSLVLDGLTSHQRESLGARMTRSSRVRLVAAAQPAAGNRAGRR